MRHVLHSPYLPLTLDISLRGIGWEWGSTLDTLPPVYREKFGRRSILEAFKHQFISTVSVGVLTYAMDNDDSLAQALGYERTWLAEYVSDVVQTIALASAAWSGLSLGYHYLAATVYAYSRATSQSFDPERWPALLDDPLQMHSVHDFWTNKWHVIFKRQFVMCGYKPVVAVCHRIGIKGDLARLLGVQGAFFISALLHEYGELVCLQVLLLLTILTGIRNALNNIHHPDTYPSLVFFQLSAIAIALEMSFERFTGRKVGGSIGRTWAWLFLLVTGVPMMRHWMHGGRLGYIAPPRLWTKRKLLIPFAFMAPSQEV